MPVPFRDIATGDGLLVGVLRILPVEGAGRFAAALLLARGNGEPLEFVYNQLDVPATTLCMPDRLPGFMTAMIARSLFTTLEGTPQWIMVCAGEVAPELFEMRLDVNVPVGASALPESGDNPGPVWLGTVPPSDDVRTAAGMLIRSGLAAEMLTRTAAALRDVVARDVLDEPLVGGRAAT
ncbi:MAG: hypothetical protein ACREL7_08610 [Longimicrobiales bacterium]